MQEAATRRRVHGRIPGLVPAKRRLDGSSSTQGTPQNRSVIIDHAARRDHGTAESSRDDHRLAAGLRPRGARLARSTVPAGQRRGVGTSWNCSCSSAISPETRCRPISPSPTPDSRPSRTGAAPPAFGLPRACQGQPPPRQPQRADDPPPEPAPTVMGYAANFLVSTRTLLTGVERTELHVRRLATSTLAAASSRAHGVAHVLGLCPDLLRLEPRSRGACEQPSAANAGTTAAMLAASATANVGVRMILLQSLSGSSRTARGNYPNKPGAVRPEWPLQVPFRFSVKIRPADVRT